jgi:hypothetical protein
MIGNRYETIEDPDTVYHDTREIFDNGRVAMRHPLRIHENRIYRVDRIGSS